MRSASWTEHAVVKPFAILSPISHKLLAIGMGRISCQSHVRDVVWTVLEGFVKDAFDGKSTIVIVVGQ